MEVVVFFMEVLVLAVVVVAEEEGGEDKSSFSSCWSSRVSPSLCVFFLDAGGRLEEALP